jgi:hypothetical protein
MKVLNLAIACMVYAISCQQAPKTKSPPSAPFQEFVAHLATFKWLEGNINSSVELHTYTELKKEKRTLFDPYSFYAIAFEDSKIGKSYQLLAEDNKGKKVFEKVKHIWGYFYENANSQDGVIEEWTFCCERAAKAALEQLSKPRFVIYFADNLHYCRVGKRLFIFQTESAFYTNEQKTIFELFVKRAGAEVPF